MHTSLDTITRVVLMPIMLCMFMASPAIAIDPQETRQAPLEEDREYLLATASEAGEREKWLSSDNFHIVKKAGFGYTRRFKLSERAFSIGVRGPVMRKQKALGLAFRIRF